MDVRKYSKAIAAVATAVAVAASFAADGEFSVNDTIGTILAFLGAIGVYQVENK
jgi:hypothetical protein